MADNTTDLDEEHKRLLNAKLDAEIEQIRRSMEHERDRWTKEYYLKVGTVVGGILSTLVFTLLKKWLDSGV